MKTQDIAEANGWWKFGKDFYYYDHNLKNLKKPIEFKRNRIDFKPGNIHIIRGPRQVGKTVWIKQTIKELLSQNIEPKSIFYLSCDLLTGKTRKELSDAIKFYLNNIGIDRNPVYIFLDEITFVNDWNIELKTLADKGITEKCVIVLTGSNPWKIKNKKERLPGRGVEGNEKLFYPLAFREFVFQTKELAEWFGRQDTNLIASLRQFYEEIKNFEPVNLEDKNSLISSIQKLLPYQKELQFLFRIYLITGGFPESINSFLSNKYLNKKGETIDNTIYERYINVLRGDLANMVGNENSIREMLRVIIKCYSSKYSFNDIANEMSNSSDHKTVANYTELLKENLLTRIFFSYEFKKMSYRPKADKKIYFYDPFIFYSVKSWLSGKIGSEIYSEILLNDELLSTIIEGMVGNHLACIKEKSPMKEFITFLWFYYDRSKEIDFLYKKENEEYIGIEVKYQNNVSRRDVSIIDRTKEYILVSKDTTELEEIPIIPIHLFLFSLQKSEGYI